MNNASPAPFLPPRSPAVPGRGLAPYEVLSVKLEDDTDDLPVSAEKRLAPESEDFGGLLIALGYAAPAGLLIWAAIVVALVW